MLENYCPDENCLLKQLCRRGEKPTEIYYHSFDASPLVDNGESIGCELFWNNSKWNIQLPMKKTTLIRKLERWNKKSQV